MCYRDEGLYNAFTFYRNIETLVIVFLMNFWSWKNEEKKKGKRKMAVMKFQYEIELYSPLSLQAGLLPDHLRA